MEINGRYTRLVQHYDIEGNAHELTFSCYLHRPFLDPDGNKQLVLDAIEKARTNYGFHLWGYVVMPEHVHLLIFPVVPCKMKDVLQSIKQSVGRRVISSLKKCKSPLLSCHATGQKTHPYRFWQDGPGYDRNMWSVDAIHSSLEYIHNNPVVRQLVAYPDEWKWSSFRAWHGERNGLAIDMDTFPLKSG